MKRRSRFLAGSALAALLQTMVLAAPAAAQGTTLARLTVEAGGHERVDVPVVASLRGVPLHLAEGELRLHETTRGRAGPVASQLRPGAPDRLGWILTGRTASSLASRFSW